jgi:hypothetical protein
MSKVQKKLEKTSPKSQFFVKLGVLYNIRHKIPKFPLWACYIIWKLQILALSFNFTIEFLEETNSSRSGVIRSVSRVFILAELFKFNSMPIPTLIFWGFLIIYSTVMIALSIYMILKLLREKRERPIFQAILSMMGYIQVWVFAFPFMTFCLKIIRNFIFGEFDLGFGDSIN